MKQDRDRDERVSLAGLDPENVLRALLKVDPADAPADTGKGDESDSPATGGF